MSAPYIKTISRLVLWPTTNSYYLVTWLFTWFVLFTYSASDLLHLVYLHAYFLLLTYLLVLTYFFVNYLLTSTYLLTCSYLLFCYLLADFY